MTNPVQSESPNPLSGLSPLKRALLAVEEMQARVAEAERARSEPIAIIGMGCRFPGAPDPESFWHLLARGGDAICEVPASRWSLDDFFSEDVNAPDKMITRWGGFLDQVDQFDPEFFGISPREAALMDPQQRLLLEVAWEALENAAQGPAQWVQGKTGVFVGITGDEYAQRIFRRSDPALFNAYFASGIARSVAGGRISYTLGLEGPNFSVDTACSSSLVALHNACVYLRTGQCRMALAGGVNVILSPEIGITFSKAHMMSSDGRCKTFDARADGFVRAEGCGLIVLKRLSDARADGDCILALIRGSAINQDGRSSGLTVPNVRAQESVVREALAVAGLEPAQISYIETHGTGTALGDPIEAHALARVFAADRTADPLVLGAVKTNVGHLEAAAGIAGAIKTVLALQHEEIPANLHFGTMNPHIDWAGLPIEIPVRNRPWRRGAAARRAGVSAFGFSGTNAHVVLEEAPCEEHPASVDRLGHLLTISARTPTALCALASRYAGVLTSTTATAADVCFSANTGRAHFSHRIAVTGTSTQELHAELLKATRGAHPGSRDGLAPVFLFAGQGAQYPGMGKELYQTHPEFRRSIDACAELLRSELDEPLTEVLWGSATHRLDETAFTQPALFAIEYALAELWRGWGVEPAAVLGHSIGEYAAACAACVWNLEDGIRCIAARGRLMQGVGGNGAMAAALTSEERVRDALDGLDKDLSIAAVNAPENIVFSGDADALAIAEERLKSQGIRVQRLKVSRAFHSPQMNAVADAFADVMTGLRTSPPRLRWISSVTGEQMGRHDAAVPQYWRRQVRETVQFRTALETLDRQGSLVFLEIGPGATLSTLGLQTIGGGNRLWLPSLTKKSGEWQQILSSLGRLYVSGASVDWNSFDRPYARRRVMLPTYPFERQSCWFADPEPARPLIRGMETTVASTAQQAPEPLYAIQWEPIEHPAPTASPASDWLLVADRSGMAKELAARLSGAGHRVTVVEASGEIRKAAAAVSWKGVVFLCALDAPSPAMLHSDSLESAERDLFGKLLDLVHELASAVQATAPRLWLVTRGAQAATRDDTVSVAQSTLWGAAQAIVEEYPEWNCACIDLDPADNAADGLFSELLAEDGEEAIVLRQQQRLAMRIDRTTPSAQFGPRIVPEATYLVTGGFGALGQQIARWLIEQGARNLVLVSRSEPIGAGEEFLNWAAASGVQVLPYRADIARYANVERMMTEITSSLPLLRGIVHTAGVLDDGILAQQTWERFAPVLAPKVAGSWNLHELTRSLPLDFFVMFSSIAALAGAPGQGNYAAANAFEDALAHYRRRLGLPATSIAWGAWAEGMAANPRFAERRRSAGIATMPAAEALQLFAAALSGAHAHVIAGAFDWDQFAARYGARAAPGRFRRLLAAPAEAPLKTAHLDLQGRLAELPPAAGLPFLREWLGALAVRLLGFPAGRAIDPAQPLQELGLDSLMAIEFRNALSEALGRSLPATLLFSCPALDDLTKYISGLFWGTVPPPNPEPAANTADLLDRLEKLSDEELDRMLAEQSGASQ